MPFIKHPKYGNIQVPDNATPADVERIVGEIAAQVGDTPDQQPQLTQPPAPRTIPPTPPTSPPPESSSRMKQGWDKLWTPLMSEIPDEVAQQALPYAGPLGLVASKIPPVRQALAEFSRSMTAPGNIGMLVLSPAQVAIRGVKGVGMLGSKLLQALEKLASTGFLVEGAHTVKEAYLDPNTQGWDKAAGVGAGLLEAGMGVVGLRHPVTRSAASTPPVQLAPGRGPALDTTLQQVLRQAPTQLPTKPSAPLAVPPRGSTVTAGIPDFVAGPAGIAPVMEDVRLLSQQRPDSIGRVVTPSQLDTGPWPGGLPQGTGTMGGNELPNIVKIDPLTAARNKALGYNAAGQSLPGPPKAQPQIDAETFLSKLREVARGRKLNNPDVPGDMTPTPIPIKGGGEMPRTDTPKVSKPVPSVVPKPTPIKATFIGEQEGKPGNPAIRLYNITAGGNAAHPVNSTVSEKTLLEMGWKPPKPTTMATPVAEVVPTQVPAPPMVLGTPTRTLPDEYRVYGDGRTFFAQTGPKGFVEVKVSGDGSVRFSGNHVKTLNNLTPNEAYGQSFGYLKVQGELPKPESNQAGFIKPNLLRTLGASTVSGISGSFVGDTPEERLMNAGIYALGAGTFTHALQRKPTPGSPLPQLKALREAQAAGPKSVVNVAARPTALGRTSQTLRTKWVDQLAPYYDRIAEAKDRAAARTGKPFALTAEQDGYIQAALHLGGGMGKATQTMRRYRNVLEASERENLVAPLQDMLNVRGMKHAVDETFDAHLTKAAATGDVAEWQRITDGLANGTLLPQGITQTQLPQLQTALNQSLGSKAARVNQLADEIFSINRDALELSHQGGLIPDALYTELKARVDRNGDFNPLTRILDAQTAVTKWRTSTGNGADLPQQGVIKTLIGSMRDTESPIAASLRRYTETFREVERNAAAKAAYGMHTLGPEFASWIKPFAEGQTTAPKGFTPIHYLEGGKPVTFAVPDIIAKSLQLALVSDVTVAKTAVGKFLHATSQPQRLSAVGLNPFFAASNIFRDYFDLMALAKGVNRLNPLDYAKMAGSMAKSWVQVLREDPIYIKEVMETGAGLSTIQSQLTPDTIMGYRSRTDLGGKLLDILSRISNASESAGKLTLAKRLKQLNTMTPDARAYEVRNFGGSSDFWRHGTAMQEAGAWTLFLNAQVQGIARNKRLLEDPKLLAANVFAAFLTAAAITRWNSQFKDSDGTPSLKHVSDTDMQTSFVILQPAIQEQSRRTGKPEPTPLKIPMGFTQRVIFGPIMAAFNYATGLRDESKTQIALDAISHLIPTQTQLKEGELMKSLGHGVISTGGPVPRVLVQEMMNRNTSFDIPIISKPVEAASAPQQFDTTTDPLAKLLATGASKVPVLDQSWLASPKRMEHILSGMGVKGGAADLAYQPLSAAVRRVTEEVPSIADQIAQTNRDLAADPVKTLRKAPVFGGLFRRFVGSGVDQVQRDQIDDLYDLYGKAKQAQDDLALNKRIRPEQARQMVQDPETRKLLQLTPALQPIVTQLSKVHAVRAQLLTKPDTPERRQSLASLDRTEAAILARASAFMRTRRP